MTLAYLSVALPFTAGEPGAAVLIAMLFAPLMCSHGTIARATSGGCETVREVEISFASFAWSRAQGSLIGSNSTASQPAPAVITYGKVPASVVRARVHAWPKFEVIHLLSFHLSSSTTVNSDHQPPYQHTQQDLGHVATQPTLANFVSTNRAASTSKYPEAPHRQTNRPSTRTSTPQTYHQHVRRSCHRPDGKHYSQRAYFHR
jgi:hypothetical protein